MRYYEYSPQQRSDAEGAEDRRQADIYHSIDISEYIPVSPLKFSVIPLLSVWSYCVIIIHLRA